MNKDLYKVDEYAHLPFFTETCQLFECVKNHDFDQLADLCDDDFGIVDLDPEGRNVIVKNRTEWENWFHTLFQNLKTISAETYTEILAYQALETSEMGYGVVDFCQYLVVEGQTHRFFCVVTIIWKKAGNRWVESRWHCSLIERK
jgi:ketosteroid isomerase-like protein